ncbi:hypothetical protein EPA93_47720 [Ktedonosporobacter rubrisoli]|uniref:CpsD/CapB family tyrosine-protein kinase n=1 Tax=Ktedonosporobacter rubrisoli TaxID=2509675 RepID=A0A4P6K4S1_KTERU|nr:hypothetical protein [Ktedonosporobacter rubrisoli]QBD83249.1 hypothetical protein EPA93_47720 [Ktedonosporobacter rubrisoli]
MGEDTQESTLTQEVAHVNEVEVNEQAPNPSNGNAPASLTLTSVIQPIQETHKSIAPQMVLKRDKANIRLLQEKCRQFCLATFFRQHEPVRSLGITSSISGEGKSLLALALAQVLAEDSTNPVILLECNWEHRSLHKHLDIPLHPGLAEWLRGECSEQAIRHEITPNLTAIPAGNSKRDTVKLLQQIQQQGLLDMLAHNNALLLVDLPSILTTAYGALAASLAESIAIVVRAGATTDFQLTETCSRLKGLSIEGLVFNQMQSKIPRWIQRIL